MTSSNIKSVAIIGAGPGGIASIYELSHTNSDGTSTIGKEKSANPQFTKIVAFEQKSRAGGIWAPDLNSADYPVPPQELLDTEKYHNPDTIHPTREEPEGLGAATLEKPVTTPFDKMAHELQWNRSGLYPNLFTNIPSRFVRFSYIKDSEKFHDKARSIFPFLTGDELTDRVQSFVEENQLNDYIRFNTKVHKIRKNANGKWTVSVIHTNAEKGVDEWYSEEFDAVISANGHYTVPNFPHIPGLAELNKNHPGQIIHANSYRGVDEFVGKKVLVIGGSISTANLVQYLVPVSSSVTISIRNKHLVFPWINEGIRSEGIIAKTTVDKIDPQTGVVTFSDGTTDSGFEKILFTTGYHYHFPFLEDDHKFRVVNPSNLSRVSGLFFNTFSVDDPTLATVGVTISPLNFHTIEASAAAIAGVWSGAVDLPSREEQAEWEKGFLELKGDNVDFHFFNHYEARDLFIKPISKYFPKNRPDPLEGDSEHLTDIEVGVASLEKLFYKLKLGELKVEETIVKLGELKV